MSLLSPTAAFVVAIAVGTLSAIASLVTAWVTYKNTKATIFTQVAINRDNLSHQTEQERVKDVRTLRDAKLARIRGRYIAAVEAAFAIESIFVSEQYIASGQTKEERDAYNNEQWRVAAAKLDVLYVELELESDTQEILTIARTMVNSFRQFRSMRQANLADRNSFPWQKVTRLST